MTANDQARTATGQAFPDGHERWPQGRRPMTLGLMVPISERHAFADAAPRFRDILDIVRTAEAVGFDAAWFADHFLFADEAGTDVRGV